MLLAGFSVLTAFTFHNHFADQTQVIMFWKNISMVGGFLLLIVHGAGPISIDGRWGKRPLTPGMFLNDSSGW